MIQISALLVFSVIAIGYRLNHNAEGAHGYALVDGKAVSETVHQVPKMDDQGNPVKDEQGKEVMEDEIKDGKPVMDPVTLTWKEKTGLQRYSAQWLRNGSQGRYTVGYHASAVSVVKPQSFSFVVIQACMAILILVGFESVTSLGEEAKHAKRDIPRAVLLSLFIQGVVCYLVEYFAANYFLNSAYQMKDAAGSTAPAGI